MPIPAAAATLGAIKTILAVKYGPGTAKIKRFLDPQKRG